MISIKKIKDFIGARVETSSVRPSVGVRLPFIRSVQVSRLTEPGPARRYDTGTEG